MKLKKTEFYRSKAEEAEREAQGAPEEQKQYLLHLADRWRALALMVGAHEFADPSDITRESDEPLH